MFLCGYFDIKSDIDHGEINQLVRSVFETFSDDERRRIEGKSNNKGRANSFTHLKIVLIDLYVAWKTDPELSNGLARGSDAYKVNSRYNALYISPRVRSVVDILSDHQLLETVGGSYDRKGTGKFNHTSRIRASASLRVLFKELSIENFQLELNKNQECIVLTDFDTDKEGNFITVSLWILDNNRQWAIAQKLCHNTLIIHRLLKSIITQRSVRCALWRLSIKTTSSWAQKRAANLRPSLTIQQTARWPKIPAGA